CSGRWHGAARLTAFDRNDLHSVPPPEGSAAEVNQAHQQVTERALLELAGSEVVPVQRIGLDRLDLEAGVFQELADAPLVEEIEVGRVVQLEQGGLVAVRAQLVTELPNDVER